MNMNQNHYRRLLIMAALSFIAMYFLMYAMVNAIGNVFTTYLKNVILSVAKDLYSGKCETLRSRTPALAGGARGCAPSE